MFVKLCLFTCALTLGQEVNRNRWQLAPRFERGQELVYSGIYEEESLAPGVEFRRRYRLHTRVMVLDHNDTGWSAAFLTSLQLHRNRQGSSPDKKDRRPSSVRVQIANVDKQGKITNAQGGAMLPILDGPPTIESGCIVAVPKSELAADREWAVLEPGRPPLTWRIAGTEVVSATRCVKLEGKQQSADWGDPRADSTAWKRVERVWVSAQSGVVYRLERIIERREPARTQPTARHIVRYDLDRNWIYPRKTLEHQRNEILQATRFDREAEEYIHKPIRYRTQLAALQQRISRYLAQQREETLQRQALEQVKHRIEAVQRGEVVIPYTKSNVSLIPEATIGKRAPDFLVTDLISKRSVRLYTFLGKPVLVVFYNPKTEAGRRVLRFAKELHGKYKSKLSVLAMAVSDDVAFIRKQQKELALPFPVLDGKGLHRTFRVDATPRMILLDERGLVQSGHTGWGVQVPQEVMTGLQRLWAKR